MMFDGRKRSFSSSWSRWFSSSSRCCSSSAALAQADRLRDHRGDDRKQPHVLVARHRLGEQAVRAQRPDRLVAQLDRNADERNVLLLQPAARAGPVQEQRLLRDARHDRRAAGLDHLAGDPFAAPVDSPLPLARRQPVRRLDVDLARPAVQQRQRPAQHAHVPRHRVEHRVDRVADVHACRSSVWLISKSSESSFTSRLIGGREAS